MHIIPEMGLTPMVQGSKESHLSFALSIATVWGQIHCNQEQGSNFPMHVSAGPSSHSWHPIMVVDTTRLDYWFNWRVLLCVIWVLSSVILASSLIWRYEGSNTEGEDGEELEAVGVVYDDESWRPCFKEVHPAWLLASRIVAFFLLSILLTVYAVEGGSTFSYYTQWTFALVTIYFALGSLLSMHGCHQYLNKVDGDQVDHMNIDSERGTYVAPTHDEDTPSLANIIKNSEPLEENQMRQIAGSWGYAFQILYQMIAGAVMLTDCVFWFIIVPFLAIRDYSLSFLTIGMHSVNAIFLLVDIFLNSMRFPWFRISYFLIWTAIYVFFQWIIHACVSIWWPYPFLDLSSQYAPIWYLLVAVLHVPCYAIFPLLLKLKHLLLSTWFPHSYRSPTR